MGSVGDCFDNALCESFFATLECDWLDRVCMHNHAAARQILFDYIEGFYNTHRLHSALEYHSPMEYEQLHKHTTQNPRDQVATIRR